MSISLARPTLLVSVSFFPLQVQTPQSYPHWTCSHAPNTGDSSILTRFEDSSCPRPHFLAQAFSTFNSPPNTNSSHGLPRGVRSWFHCHLLCPNVGRRTGVVGSSWMERGRGQFAWGRPRSDTEVAIQAREAWFRWEHWYAWAPLQGGRSWRQDIELVVATVRFASYDLNLSLEGIS